ncbi:DUF1254 domain-containing protein [Nocardia yamanashiensis]|uniref:DUF1254 domain-containing protein n=1 Tax=Nocardia yamanashiensis TaxID=209247 RepID=UPI001E2BEE17|nr:DUF1254 domain-containing protein [Nocardia yamanashiensis]UGT42493.1 DUF1254 domain-containing protein [Nocardia yamanashiensis]
MRFWKVSAVLLVAAVAATATACGSGSDEGSRRSDEVRKIAKEAYVYGFPMVDMYRIENSYVVDKNSSQYMGDWNQIHSIARVFTPADTAVQTPNSDTPYSFLVADLRTEPLVLTVPPIEEKRYYSVQFIDNYTYVYDLIGSRTTGNGGGTYLLAGPGWKGDKPAGVDKVITSATDFSMVLYRTQLFDPADLDNVKQIQSEYRVKPLSEFEHKPAPSPAPAVDFIAPLTPDAERTSLDFFKVLNFTLKYAPVLPDEREMRARFATIGIGPDSDFDPAKLSDEERKAFQDGMSDAWAELHTFQQNELQTGKVNSGQLFGSAEQLNGNYLYRFAGAVMGILGLPGAEAMYFPLTNDSSGAKLNGGSQYTLTFPAGQLPPVKAFWSVTMYKLPEILLAANPIDRYLINSPMLPNLVRNPDGGITLYLQQTSPGPDREANWLPTPPADFEMILRTYWPEQAISDGSWTPPKVQKA